MRTRLAKATTALKALDKVQKHKDRRIKELMFGRMEGQTGGEDDITEWDKPSLQKLCQAAMDTKSWKSLVKMESNSYGC